MDRLLRPFQNFSKSLRIACGSAYSKIMNDKVPLILIIAMCLLYEGIMLFYTHGGLIYGWDKSGYYSVGQALATADPDGFVNAIGIFLGLGNFYAGFYIALFITAVLTLIGMYFLTVEIFEGYLDKNYLTLAGLAAAFLYLFNPSILTYVFVPYTQNLSITNAAFLLLLIEAVRFYKSGAGEGQFKTMDAALMGIGLGLSLGAFPNGARYFVVGVAVFVFFALMKLVFNNSQSLKEYAKAFIKAGFVFAIATLISGFYLIYPVLGNYGNFASTAGYASLSHLGALSFYTGNFNIMLQAIRLMAGNAFGPDSIIPYNTLYFSNPLAVFSSILWVIFALAVPIIVAGRNSYRILLPIELILMVSVFWATGANPPLGSLYLFIVNHMPFGYKLIPPTFLAAILLSKLYCIMVAFSVVAICMLILRGRVGLFARMHRDKRQEIAFISAAIMIILLILAMGLPTLDGQINGVYFGEAAMGFFVPQQYQTVSGDMANISGTILLLPSTSTYVQTSWGDRIGNSFYNEYFYPANIITLSSEGGPYARYIPSTLANYTALTTPITPSAEVPINYQYNNVFITPSNYALKNGHISFLSVGTYKPIQITWSFTNPVSITNLAYLTVAVNVTNMTQLQNIVSNGTMKIDINYGAGSVASYNISQSCQNCYIQQVNNNTVDVSLLIKQPSNLFTPSQADLGHVEKLSLTFTNGSMASNLTLFYPRLYGGNQFSISPQWLNALMQNNVSYILIDHTIIGGALQSQYYQNLEATKLTSAYYIKPVFVGKDLSLYKINYA